MAVPGGTREVLAENVLAAWLDLEVASGNDAIASHSEIRKTGKLMGQFLPGTDFVTSGYSSMPRYDNMFGGGNYDSDDLDEWLTLQRDWQVDAGIEPLGEEDAIAVRSRAAHAVQAVYDVLGFPPISDEEVRLAATCLDSRDLPDRDRAADVHRRRSRAVGADQRPRRRARAGRARLRGRRRCSVRDAAAEGRGGLSADVGDHRRGRSRRVGGERRQRLRRPGHRLSARRRALAASAAAAVHDRRAAPRLSAGHGTCRRGDDRSRWAGRARTKS